MLRFACFRSRGICAGLLLVAPLVESLDAFNQTARTDRFWLAGRYDGNRIIVYFDAVHFGAAHLPAKPAIAPPVTAGFFGPTPLSRATIDAALSKVPNAELFRVGDRYELLLGNNEMTTITLTSLVGCEGDEEVGNDSYVGALGIVENSDWLLESRNYYVVTRSPAEKKEAGRRISESPTKSAGLEKDPVPQDVQAQMSALMSERYKSVKGDGSRDATQAKTPSLAIQSFTLANGQRRFYVRARWGSSDEHRDDVPYALGAWMTAQPLQILAIERQTSSYGFEDALPSMKNVVGLGQGRTGLVVATHGEDSMSLTLLEYRDGVGVASMRPLQTISAAE